VNRAALATWRISLEAETPIRLTVPSPPVTTQVTQDYSVRIEEEPAAAIGQSLSSEMVRLLGHPDGYGTAFPVRRALAEWNRYCRRHHRGWPDHADRPVCAELAALVIRDRTSVRYAADVTGVTYLRAERLLLRAVEHMVRWQGRWFEVDLPR
jgi:hypothetical protein